MWCRLLLIIASAPMAVAFMAPFGYYSLVLALQVGAPLPESVGNDVVGEQIRQIAAVLPNMGKPDIYYPLTYEGDWTVEREVTEVNAPLSGERPILVKGLEQSKGQKSTFRRFFSRYNGNVILDRSISTTNEINSMSSDGPVLATFDPANPNTLLVTTSTGKKIDIRVTKRSVEDMANVVNGNQQQDASATVGGVSFSEFSRVTEEGPDSPPRQWGVRILGRYKQLSDDEIVGLERLYLYSGDTLDMGGKPDEVVKSRLSLKRVKEL